MTHDPSIPTRPERFSAPTRLSGGRAVVNVDNYVPYFLSAINNAMSRGASKLYLEQFGIGIVEWRIVSMLAIERHISAMRICEVVALDKSSTSRGLKSLDAKGLLISSENQTDPRRKIWALSETGAALHDQILRVALERERKLLRGVDAADLEITLRVMRQMRQNVKDLDI